MKRHATDDLFDLDLDQLEFEDSGEVVSTNLGDSVGISTATASNEWQISGELLPSNPNTVSTTFEQKLSGISIPEDLYRFKPRSIRTGPTLPEKSSNSDNPLYKGSGIVWGDLGISRPVLKAIDNILKFASPTEIQREVIPLAVTGRDIMATAATGSGKTAAFLLPIMERILTSPHVSQRRKNSCDGRISGGRAVTRAIILLPTRELAIQCWSMLKALCTFVPITSALVVGGFDSRDQKVNVTRCPDIIVATPGRLLDHILNTQGIHLEFVDMVVLDEADRLLELGFRDAISEIMRAIPKKTISNDLSKRTPRGQCQTLLFSATLCAAVKDLAAFVLRDAAQVRVSDPTKVVDTLTQEFVKIPRCDLRDASFFSIIDSLAEAETSISETTIGRVIVFFNEKKESHRIANAARVFGLPVAELNGNMNQVERMAAIADFQAGTKRYLFATDVASRGLDLPMVELVINFDLPPSIDSETRYIHRVGRTARGGNSGRSISLYAADEYSVVKRIIKKNISKEQREKVFERRIPVEMCATWARRLHEIANIIKQIDKEEQFEQEVFISSKKINRIENMHKFGSDIAGRPQKVWFKNKLGPRNTNSTSRKQKKHRQK